jgi:hypothetical protein
MNRAATCNKGSLLKEKQVEFSVCSVVGPGDVSKTACDMGNGYQGEGNLRGRYDNADLPYAPPFSLAIDHSIAGAHIIQNKLKGRDEGYLLRSVRKKSMRVKNHSSSDTRGPDEFEQMRLGIGERLIPLGALRSSY